MASDKRAARLGLLAAVAVMLFSGIGARLWFLQTVEAQSLQQVVDQRNTSTVLIAPERGQIFDHDGRLLAGNEPIYNIAVGWAAMSRPADRAALFSRLSGWVGVPVEEMEARYDSGNFDPLRPLPIAEDVAENVVIALSERSEDFPGVTMVLSYRRVYPYAPLAAHVVGYMGAITEEDVDHYKQLGYDTSNRGEEVGRAGVELEYETILHGEWGEIVYEVDSHGSVVREISRKEAVNGMDVQLSIDLDIQQYAERLLQTQLRLKRAFTAPNPVVKKPDGTLQADVAQPRTACVLRGAGRFGDRDEPPDRSDHGDGQLPDVRQPVVQPGHQWRQVRRAVRDPQRQPGLRRRGPTGVPAGPRSVVADQPGDPGPVQHGFDVQGVRRLVGPAHRPDQRRPVHHRQRDVQGRDDRRTTSAPRASSACGATRSARGSTGRAATGAINMQLSLAVSSDVYYYRLGEQFFVSPGTNHLLLQDELRNFGFGAETGIDLPYEFDGRIPDHETKKADLVDSGVLAEERRTTGPPRRRDQPGDRPGPAGGDADAARRRLLARSPTAAT